LDHLRNNVCQGSNKLYHWVSGWFAQIVQRPQQKIGTSLVLRGKQGVGKTKVGEVIGSLLGSHYVLAPEPRFITGRFNAHLIPCLLLHADEGFWAGDKQAEGKLKNLENGDWLCSSVLGSHKCFPAALRNYIVLRMPKPLDVLHGNQMGDFVANSTSKLSMKTEPMPRVSAPAVMAEAPRPQSRPPGTIHISVDEAKEADKTAVCSRYMGSMAFFAKC
jgi:hypothetical protein